MSEDFFGLFGLKFGTIIAGTIGGVASLAFITDLTPKAGFTAVIGGAICAGYLTPAAASFLSMTGSMENALAFFLGVCGMNLVGGLFRLSDAFKTRPLSTFQDIVRLIFSGFGKPPKPPKN